MLKQLAFFSQFHYQKTMLLLMEIPRAINFQGQHKLRALIEDRPMKALFGFVIIFLPISFYRGIYSIIRLWFLEYKVHVPLYIPMIEN